MTILNKRLIKLIEIATHPSTGDGERANAICLFRRLADKAGGIEKALIGNSDAVSIEKLIANTPFIEHLTMGSQTTRPLTA